MGDDKTRKQTERGALADAKRKAVEFAATYIKSEIEVKNFMLEKDLMSAYANAEVVKTESKDIRVKTRGIKLLERNRRNAPSGSVSKPATSEFFEDEMVVKTGNKGARMSPKVPHDQAAGRARSGGYSSLKKALPENANKACY
jgi:hypothetical protein